MHYFIFPEKDTWLAEMSSSQNYGGDEILELSKNITTAGETTALNGVSRVLTKFNFLGSNGLKELIDKGHHSKLQIRVLILKHHDQNFDT